jgi:hypothetical protein
MLLKGPKTGESFRTYISRVLAPTLKRGDIVVMDNVPLYRTRGVREALEGVGVKGGLQSGPLIRFAAQAHRTADRQAEGISAQARAALVAQLDGRCSQGTEAVPPHRMHRISAPCRVWPT